MERRPHISVEAEIRAPGILVQVGNYDWERPLESIEHNAVSSVTLMLSPPHSFSEGYFTLDRGARRFNEIGNIVFAPADVNLHVRASGGPIRLVHCFFERARFREITGFDGRWEDRCLQASLNVKNTRLKEILARLAQEALEPGFACGMMAEGLGIVMAAELGRHFHAMKECSRVPAQTLSPWQVNRITHYMASLSNYLPDIAEIAGMCGISDRHLRRLFKETTNQTIYQYSRDIWAEKVKMMLSETRLPIKEIAARFGFSDASSFSIAFRRATGEAPKAFRQQGLKPRSN